MLTFSGKYLWWMILGPISVFVIHLLYLRWKLKWFEKFAQISALKRLTRSRGILRTIGIGLIMSMLLLGALLILAKPEWKGTQIYPIYGPMEVDFGLDISLSVLAKDVQKKTGGAVKLISRLEMMKDQIAYAVKFLKGDKVGLIIFTENAIPVLPVLTTDYENAFLRYLNQVTDEFVKSLEGGTEFSPVFEVAAQSFSQEKVKKVFILLTDGEESEIEPGKITGQLFRALKMLKEKGVVIYIIGLGDPTKASPIPKEIAADGRVIEYYKDSDGKPSKSQPDPKKLKSIAALTGGIYLHSYTGQELGNALKDILEKERKIIGWEEKDVRRDISQEIIGLMLVLSFVLWFLI